MQIISKAAFHIIFRSSNVSYEAMSNLPTLAAFSTAFLINSKASSDLT
jgi:hypothetical protein